MSPPSPPPAPRDPVPSRTGVLLVAHGSARSGDSAEPVLRLARELARRGFAEARTAFWKEEPFLPQALHTLRSARVIVLPVFLAEGYFTRVVVPRELGLGYGENQVDGRSVRLLPPLAADPALDRLVLERARAALPDPSAAPDSALVILGHGTPRDPGSADAVLATCARLRERSGFARVVPAFIDQEPGLEQVVEEATERRTVVVPFLVASGFHGSELRGSALRDGRELIYADPVGTHPGLIDVVEGLLRDADADSAPVADTIETPLAALEPALRERIERLGTVTLLQLEIRAVARDEYALRHVDDAGASELTLVEMDDPDALVALARRTRSGGHRPLRTAADLTGGWRHRATGIRALVEALVALYGPVVAHWQLGERGGLTAHGFAEVASRQTGMYARLQQAEPAAVAEGIRRVCDGLPCLRTRLWGPPPPGRAPENAQGARLVVPCPAPCPILLGAVLETTPGPA